MALDQNTIVSITAIATFISSIGTLLAAFFAARSASLSRKSIETSIKINGKEREERLIQDFNKIIEIGVEYPYLESKVFTEKWVQNMESSNEQYLRYDMYCNLLFNFLSRLYSFYDKDKTKIENFVDIKSWVRLHKYNWHNPVDPNENIDAYSEEFRRFINSYINT